MVKGNILQVGFILLLAALLLVIETIDTSPVGQINLSRGRLMEKIMENYGKNYGKKLISAKIVQK